MSLEVIAELVGDNPPSICFIIAFILLLVGYMMDEPTAFSWAFLFFIAGIVLQVLWLKR